MFDLPYFWVFFFLSALSILFQFYCCVSQSDKKCCIFLLVIPVPLDCYSCNNTADIKIFISISFVVLSSFSQQELEFTLVSTLFFRKV